MRRRVRFGIGALLLLGSGAVAMIAPRVNPRNEASYAAVEVIAPPEIDADSWVLVVRVRNTKAAGERRRLWVRGIDLSESLLGDAQVFDAANVEAERIPLAKVRRVPMRVEIPSNQSRDVRIQIRGLAPGRHQGAVDVILDSTTWIRTEVAWESK